MLAQPLVSVIIPAYNCARYLPAAIESALRQTYPTTEIIVVDDGSTDETPEVLSRYPSIVAIRQKNGGLSHARNQGIGKARGEYIALLDGDDIWPDGKLAEQMAIIQANPEVGVLFGNARRFADDGWTEAPLFERYGLDAEYFGDKQQVMEPLKKLLRMNFIPVGTAVVKKAWLIEAGLFDENFRRVEDWDIWLRIALKHPFHYSERVWKLKRVHSTNLSNDTEAMALAAIEVMQKLKREHAGELSASGVDIQEPLKQSYRSLGYLYLRQLQLSEAKKALWLGLDHGFDARTLAYLAGSYLGKNIVRSVLRVRDKSAF